MPVFNLLLKNLMRKKDNLGKVCDNNKYAIKYLMALEETRERSGTGEEDLDESEDEIHSAGVAEDMDVDEQNDSDLEELQAKWTDDDDDS